MVGTIQAAVRRIDKSAPLYGVTTLTTRLGAFQAERRFQTSLLVAFSLVALFLAAIGIYGVIQHSTAMRTHEIGIRMAVGAQRSDIFTMIVGEGLKLSLTGLGLGLVGALWLGRLGSSLLFGVTATDPPTYAIVSLLLTAVALLFTPVNGHGAARTFQERFSTNANGDIRLIGNTIMTCPSSDSTCAGTQNGTLTNDNSKFNSRFIYCNNCRSIFSFKKHIFYIKQ